MSGHWDDSSGYGPTRKGLLPVKPESTIISGLCVAGSHEGTPKRSLSGLVTPECTFPDHCKCDCHTRERTLRELMGQPEPVRAPPGAPIPPRMSAVTDLSGSPLVCLPQTVGQTEGIDAPARESSLKTRLEWRVWEVCQEYMKLMMHDTGLMSVAFFCTVLEGTSSGAIDSVLKRWEAIGFCKLERKPTRFTGLTVLGNQLGLEDFLRQVKRKH